MSPSASLSSLDHSLQDYLQTRLITASKCISEFTRSRPPSACPKSQKYSMPVHLSFQSISVSNRISKTRLIIPSKYIVMVWWRVYRDTEVTEVDWEMGSIYSGDPGVDRHHLISLYIENTHSLVPNFWSHSLFPRVCRSMQWRTSSWQHSIISSPHLPTLLQQEPLFLTNSVWMSPEARRNVDGGHTPF